MTATQLPLWAAAASYPLAAGSKTGGTSEEAAKKIHAARLQKAALRVLQTHPGGLTADEIAAELGESILSIRPRVSELKRQGLVEKTRERRRNHSGMSASVWRAV
jgi:predicted ArsR family transcriptional regulator